MTTLKDIWNSYTLFKKLPGNSPDKQLYHHHDLTATMRYLDEWCSAPGEYYILHRDLKETGNVPVVCHKKTIK